MTKEEIFNRIDFAIIIAERSGFVGTRLALINIRSQIEAEYSDANPHRKNQPREVFTIS